MPTFLDNEDSLSDPEALSAEVMETRGHIEKGDVHHWQVTLEVGCRVDD